MELTSFLIDGKAIGTELSTYLYSSLSGNTPMNFEETVSSGYTGITTIENIKNFGSLTERDYAVGRSCMIDIMTTKPWSAWTNIEKDILIEYVAYDNDTDKVMYLITTKGMEQAVAQNFVLECWHKHHKKFLDVCSTRWYYAKREILKYLSRLDAEDLFDTVELLITYYIQIGRIGKNYDDNNDGIMDFIESTNGFIGQGLEEKGYTLPDGVTWSMVINALKDIIVNGIYTKYE